MKLLLIRHGETTDNVGGVYAGITDSPLTNHGFLQAQNLGHHLIKSGEQISKIFSSDLQRAYLTAEAVSKHQGPSHTPVIRLECLREQDFGALEGQKISKNSFSLLRERNSHIRHGRKDIESRSSIQKRSDSFIINHLAPILMNGKENGTIAVVSHGIFLGYLWRALIKRIRPEKISISQDLLQPTNDITLGRLCTWSNTGYLELELQLNKNSHIHPSQDPIILPLCSQEANTANTAQAESENDDIFSHIQVRIMNINVQDHLKGLQKSKGGVGNIRHDTSQRTMDFYFPNIAKRRKL